MAWLSTTETFKQSEAKLTEQGYEATRAFFVRYTDTAAANMLAALTASGVPAKGTAHPSIASIVASEISVSIPYENNRQLFLVTVGYTTTPEAEKNPGAQTYSLKRDQPPWERGPILSLTGSLVEEPMQKDKTAPTPLVVANSQGELFDPPVMGKRVTSGFNIRFAAREEKIQPRISGLLALLGTCNDGAWAPAVNYKHNSGAAAASRTIVSIADQTYVFSGLQADGAIWSLSSVEYAYYNVTLSFTSEDIVKKILDRGYRGKLATIGGASALLYFKKDGTLTHDTEELDTQGNRIPTTPAPVPIFLDSNGFATLTASDAAELTFQIAAKSAWTNISTMLTDR